MTIRVHPGHPHGARRALLGLSKMIFERGDESREIVDRGVPNLFQVHLAVIVSDDVAHAAHAAEGQAGEECLGGRGETARRFADDFQSSCFSGFERNAVRSTKWR